MERILLFEKIAVVGERKRFQATNQRQIAMQSYTEILKEREERFGRRDFQPPEVPPSKVPFDTRPLNTELTVRPATDLSQPHTHLFPLLGGKVRTPGGTGVLWQVFAEKSGVLLDEDARKIVRYFPTTEIQPVAAEIGK